jgi:hypothetical protein
MGLPPPYETLTRGLAVSASVTSVRTEGGIPATRTLYMPLTTEEVIAEQQWDGGTTGVLRSTCVVILHSPFGEEVVLAAAGVATLGRAFRPTKFILREMEKKSGL